MFKKIKFQIEGVHDRRDKDLIETEIDVLDGVKDIRINYPNGKCWLEFDDSKISQKKIFKTIKKLNYSVKLPSQQKRKRNYWLFFIILAVAVTAGYYLFKKPVAENIAESQCKVSEMTFYYLDQCEWCQKVKNEGTLSMIKQLGVKVKEINAAIGPIRHQFQGVPTFVINEKVYSGYKTLDELKELLGCPADNQYSGTQNQEQPQIQTEFFGEKGEKVVLENGEIKLDASLFNDNQARFYNIEMPDEKTIYFFVIKDKNGIYRAAANACVVCFKTYKGFRQEGDEIVCNNCGNRYPIEKIATEKGGCNPGPINPNLAVRDGKIIIEQLDLEQVTELF